MANPGGIDLNTSPYYDDFDEDKKFVRVLYRPGRAVQARELTQAQTIQQSQIKRFADYFFKQGAVVEGCEQSLDLNLPYVKLQSNYDGSEIDVTDFEGKIIFSSNTGIKAYCGIVSDIEGSDPKTLFVNYLSYGAYVLTVNNAATTITPGNTITFATGNTATIEASYIDPVLGTNKILVSNVVGTLTTTTASTVDGTGTTIPLNVTAISNKTANSVFDDGETLFTSNVLSRAYASAAATRATTTIVGEGTADEVIYNYGSKYTVSEGYVYIADHFVKHSSQTVILDKYTNLPSYKVGLVPQKSYVDYIGDATLVDNAQGTPNYQAPGADRLKINTVLTKIALGETSDETDFVLLAEVNEGVATKRKIPGVESKLEEAIAKRTFEESGDYTLNDPRLNIREHLLQSPDNGGRYALADGGNTQLLIVEVEPFTCYVGGYRQELINKKEISIAKGLDTEYIEQTKTQINYGYYVEVKELVGAWDFMEATKVDLYDTAQQAITNGGFSTGSVTGTKIGEARVRAIEHVSGVPGTSTAVYYLYLYEVSVNTGYTFEQVRAIYDSATPKRFADVVLSSAGNAVLQEPSFNSLLFPLPYDAIKTIRNTNEEIETGFRFKKKFSVTFSAGVATIATTDSSETFVGNGLLNASQKNEYYAVVVNNSGANVETSSLSGTVSVSAGAAAVGGSGTAFLTEVNVGDTLNIGGEYKKVSSITSDISLTLASNHTAGASGATFTKILPAGTLIPLTLYGGSGSARTVNVTSPGTVQIDIKENATFTADVITTMDRANAREKKKTLSYQTQANINPNTHPSGLGGPFGLGYGDIYQIHGIYQSSSFAIPATTSNTNVTSNYTLNKGQTDNSYNHGYIIPKSGVVPTGRLLVVFDNFAHDTTQGLGYCSVDSYPIDDTADSNTTINTADIPTYTQNDGTIINLRDAIDFRPIKQANTSLNPLDDVGYSVPGGGLHIPTPSSDFDADLIYYKGRISKIYINNRGAFGVNDGAPKSPGKVRAAPPPKLPDTLELAEITIPPYPSRPIDATIKPLRNRRFTMKDISTINDRVEKLEYYTALGFLEKQATDKVELDDMGLDRFKNGILVDPFTGSGIANVKDAYYKAAIDRKERCVTSFKDNTKIVDLVYDTTSATTRTPGNKVFIPYTQEIFAQQPYASRQLNLAEELTFTWIGDMAVIPATDNWIETDRDPTQDIVYDDTGNADNWKALVDAWNTEVAPLNLNWIGTPKDEVVGKTDTTSTSTTKGNTTTTTTVTSGLVKTTQDAYINLAGITQGEPVSQGGDRVVDVAISMTMRSRDFIIEAKGLKNNSKMYAFFDGIDVTNNCVQIELVGNSTVQDVFDLMDKDNFCMTVAGGAATSYDTNVYRVVDSFGSLNVKNNRILVLFRVPQNTFYAGQREFKITDSDNNTDGTTTTFAKKSIFAVGVSQTKSATVINSRPFDVSFDDDTLKQSVGRQTRSLEYKEINRTVTTVTRHDPVSQSFYVDEATYRQGCYLTSIDLYFKTKSSDVNLGATVEIREMVNGFPTRKIIGGEIARLENSAIQISSDATVATTATFANPVYLQPGTDYCFTIKPDANSLDFSIWVAELGGFDVTNPDVETRIDKQPAAGVVFTSSDDYSWSIRQNIDVKFTMRVAVFPVNTEYVGVWNNIDIDSAITYGGFTPMIEDIVLSETGIKYELRLADASYNLDEYVTVKNLERNLRIASRQISTSSAETTNGFKSATLRATLQTTNKYVSPYIDDERTTIVFESNQINNETFTTVPGTITFTNGTNYVIGNSTDFSNDVFAGEYAFFGDEYRRIASITNNTFLTVQNNFTTSNTVGQQLIIRSEENPTGPYASDSRYITRVVTLNDGFEASDLVTYLNVNRPAGTSIKVYAKLLNEYDTDTFDDKFYLEMQLQGTETFTQNPSAYKEEKYILPANIRTGGSELLSGNVSVFTSNNNVYGTSTRFTEDLRIGDSIAVGVSRVERTIATIANNTFLTVTSPFAANTSGQDVFKVLNTVVAYTTPDGRNFEGFKYFAVKIVFLSANEAYAPKVKDLRVMALA